jgi:hypothetical protein
MARFADLDEAETSSLIASIRAGEYNLFIGAGVSLDSRNLAGEFLPSGDALRERLCAIAEISPKSPLQRAASSLTERQVEEELTQRFSGVVPGASLKPFPTYLWKRIFTLNIDEGLEAAYKLPGNIQRPESFHFRDTYAEPRSLDTVPIVHLHGRVTQPERGYVFDRTAYADLMSDNNAWMTVLADVMPVQPFIVMGTSMDEIDLAYYLSRRSSDTQREDRGPSFLVEPFPDKQTRRECDRYGLHLYVGTAEDFFRALNALIPDRPEAYDLVPKGTKELFPTGAPPSLVLSFSADFERVPATAAVSGKGIELAYGHPPEWSDLARNWDVGRRLSARIRSTLEACVSGKNSDRIIAILEEPGSGKTTVLRRVAFDLAQSGVTVLYASSLSKMEPSSTAEALDLIDEPIVIVVDNLADQAAAIRNIVDIAEKTDFYFLGAERGYRVRHIVRSLGDTPYRIVDGLALNIPEASQLVGSYIQRGIAGASEATRNPDRFAKNIADEPIAVASCLILNNLEPLDRIVTSTYAAAQPNERIRYLAAAIGQFCFSGGVRYEIASAVAERTGWREQFSSSHPLPLDHFDTRRDFVVPLNATLAVRTLEKAPRDDVLTAFERLARNLAPRVNRDAIRRRMPEARLAGRLFDYEDVIRHFLGEDAGKFYAAVQREWQWNSRYWEQIALYLLSRFRSERNSDLLREAVQHARHAVGIERHPFTLTTLGKVLLAQLGQPGASNSGVFSEAQDVLTDAIRIETARARVSVHAYVTLFRGFLTLADLHENPTDNESAEIRTLLSAAERYFPRDAELREVSEQVRGLL